MTRGVNCPDHKWSEGKGSASERKLLESIVWFSLQILHSDSLIKDDIKKSGCLL